MLQLDFFFFFFLLVRIYNYNLSVYVCEIPSWRLEPYPLTLHLTSHKYLYL